MLTNQYGPYRLGYIGATMESYNERQRLTLSKSLNTSTEVRIIVCNSMVFFKQELLVIAYQ